MDNAGQPFRPVLLSGKEYDAVTAALEEEEIAERRRLPVFFNAGAARAFLVFLAFFTNLQSHSGST
jgi:hypothetical protein